jgi:hypothetical protein
MFLIPKPKKSALGRFYLHFRKESLNLHVGSLLKLEIDRKECVVIILSLK